MKKMEERRGKMERACHPEHKLWREHQGAIAPDRVSDSEHNLKARGRTRRVRQSRFFVASKRRERDAPQNDEGLWKTGPRSLVRVKNN